MQREDEILYEAIRDALNELEENGEIEVVGLTADGEKIYQSTQAQQSARWQRVWESIDFPLILPALMAEYVLGYGAIALKRCGIPPDALRWMVDIVGRLRFWRYTKSQDVHLTIRP